MAPMPSPASSFVTLEKCWRALVPALAAINKSRVSILQTSFDNDGTPSAMKQSTIGLVYSIIDGYSHHQDPQLRADDIWFAALSQFSFYINAHSEELRDKFVAHKEKKELVIYYANDSRYTVDFAVFAKQISAFIQEKVIDPSLRE